MSSCAAVRRLQGGHNLAHVLDAFRTPVSAMIAAIAALVSSSLI
jgi:hypothetical protein